MVLSRHNFNDRVAAQFRQTLFKQARRAVEKECILRPHYDMNPPTQLGAERSPILLKGQSDVVRAPTFRNEWVDGARLAVPQLSRLPVGATRAKDGLKRK